MSTLSYIVMLPKDRWFKCTRCGGTGEYEMSEDCHRSAGIVPCPDCWGGTVKQETISAEEFRSRRRSDERKSWAKPSCIEVN